MHNWDNILSRLGNYHARQDGNPTELLLIIKDLIDHSGEMYADTHEARQALNAVALRLRYMVCADDGELEKTFQQLTDLLSMWSYTQANGISFPHAKAEDLEVLREERRNLDLALQEKNDHIAILEGRINRLEKELARRQAPPPVPQKSTPEPYDAPARTGASRDPFRDIPSYELCRIDLELIHMIPADVSHLVITGAERSRHDSIIHSYTFYNLTKLKTVEFRCTVHMLEPCAFYHDGELALKFQNGDCQIHPNAFSPDTRITGISAPRNPNPDSPESYARKHNIPFYPSDLR